MALTISYPESLPVSARRDDIKSAIKDHQVVIVAGETGSGKTTQLPKMLLELGLGEKGMIGHTQPRRLAARTVAERIAEELGTTIGDEVGFHVRFTGETSRNTKVKVMTDGILLAEIQRDKLLKKYNAIIIDEAHERSLNIDFLLGYLRRILPKRPDLKIVITSATIDPERFAEHFAAEGAYGAEPVPAPIIEVSGRTFPVELRYRPLNPADGMDEDELDPDAQVEDRDPLDAICDAVDELAKEAPGDILIFFSGEREIRDAAEALRARVQTNKRLSGTEILPLFARLSLAEQHRVFHPGSARRIVLATNVAETSLTVPGIKYVIDTGTARISRYSHRTKVQRLPIERVSQASANQRSGRCGRVSDGIAIRLYSEEDFESRPEFTDPEILRTNLAAVILQMSSMGVVRTARDVADFPFVQPPDSKSIADGVALLRELGALNTGTDATVTAVGKHLAQLPVDVRLGRMIVESGKRGCAKEVMVLAAALSIQDPRERPSEETGKRERAQELHKRFVDDKSDFSSLLNLWRYLQEQQKELSSSAFRRLCKNEYINYLRVREWQDLFAQLRQLAKPLGITLSPEPVDPAGHEDAIHISLLSGLLSHVGSWDERKREYVGARGTRFSVFPGSALFKKSTEWVMAAELVETSRLWARTAARLDPKWVEEVAGDLLKRSYSEPHWSRNNGAVMGYEKVTLFGLPIVPRRRIQYSRVDPELCRELFIRHALVEGDWKTHHKFFARNRRVLEDIEELETRMRRRDLRVSDEDLFEFYDKRIGPDVVSERHFDRWWKAARHEDPTLLDFDPEALLLADAQELDETAFPRTWRHGSLDLDLAYEYNPAAKAGESDGVSVRVPVLFLNQLDPVRFRWLIPGLRVELVTALIKSLPKVIRKNFVPAPDVARLAVAALEKDFNPETDDLAESLELVLRRLKGVVIPPGSWNWDALPEHLKFSFQVIDSDAKILDESKDLAMLQQTLAAANRSALARSLGVKPGASMPSGKPAGPQGAKGTAGKNGKRAPANSQAARGKSAAVATTVWERTGLTDWDAQLGINGTITLKVVSEVAGQQVTAYPALRDDKTNVRLTVFRNEAEQLAAHRTGVIRLLLLKVPSPSRYVLDHLSNKEKLVFTQNPHGSVESLIQDCTMAAVDKLVPEALPFNKADFDALYERVRAELIDTVFAVTAIVEKVLSGTRRINKEIKSASSMALINALNDVKTQLSQLVYPGFVAATGYSQLAQLPRYITAIETRLEKLKAGNVTRDNAATLQIQALEDEYDAALDMLIPGMSTPPLLASVKWMLEEFRVSLFAQELGTAYSVSEKRIRLAIKEGLAAAR
ncbi:ATP-dependent RNA helicase HrpA [Paeniglutamicibacter kerguelensis]|uniref:ATP-dependent helicase HrpA n=1 Tax=Paeniglutamicibacter kerguelensis TaxID=254788 RepID=A0ABS4XAL2_9MICC|nr:ATP-dependent RNA helicase HrpA [Paeniglutamicibacter kerguelensis]MBP2385413.1 ATP-dependent helicase HrpA [Paeniglutamicibacter kerguelensis]